MNSRSVCFFRPARCWFVLIVMLMPAVWPQTRQRALAQNDPAEYASVPTSTAQSSAASSDPAKNEPGQILLDRRIVASLPPARDKIRGFTVNIVADGSGGIGYLPVHIRVKSTSTFSADRNFVVRFEPVEFGQSPPQNGILCDIPISVPQGAKEVMVMRQLPKWSLGTAFQVRLFEDGIEFEDYAREIGALMQRNQRPPTELLNSEMALNWLQIIETQTSRTGDLSLLESATSLVNETVPRNTSSFGSLRQWNQSQSEPPITTVQPASLSSDWRHFQAFDGVLIDSDSLETLSSEYPQRFQALRDWIMAGGTIVVTAAESPESTITDLDFQSQPKYLEEGLVGYLAKTAAANRNTRRDALLANRTLLQVIANRGSNSNAMGVSQLSPAEAKEELARIDAEIASLKQAPSPSNRIWSQPVAAGRVVGITGSEQVSALDWQVVVELFGYRKSATLRRGVDPVLGDQRVRRWLIPGVAQPPVYTFMGLLTVFVILVGPIAYRRTTRVGRSYLMFAIAPVLALATTVAMFTYGVVADGFGTTTRIRQLTWVDGKSGDAFERVRSTYFAGVRPAEGLRFRPDAEVMAYPDHDGVSWEELNGKSFAISGKVDIREDAQIFDSSFLPSRAQRQFIVHQPRHQIGKLTFHAPPSSDPQDRPTLDNGFDFPLRSVVVRDQQGKYWVADGIDAGQRGVLCQSVDSEAASKALGDLYNQNRPLAAVRQTRRYSSYDRRLRDLVVTLNRNVGDANLVITDGVFETWLQKKLQVDNELPYHSFIAAADVSADVIAVKEAELVKSIRYVFGTLP